MAKGDPKGGRPRVEVNMALLAGMVRIQCTRAECAAVLEVSEKTIDRRLQEDTGEGFDAFYKRHSDEGKVSLRRAQFKLAVEKRHPTMLIWLGKQMLGQRDQLDLDNTSSDGSMSMSLSAAAVIAILKEKIGPDDAK